MRVSPLLFAALLILITSCSKSSKIPVYTTKEAKEKSQELHGKTIRIKGPVHQYIEMGGVIWLQIGKNGHSPIVECVFPLEAMSSLTGLTGEIVVEGVGSSSRPNDIRLRKARLISP